AAGAGDVPPGPDDLRELVAGVDPAGVGGRTGGAQPQGAGGPGGECLLLGDLVGGGAGPGEAGVAGGGDGAGPAPALDGADVPGAAGPVVGDPSVDHPQLVVDLVLVRPGEDPPLHVQHRAFAHAPHPNQGPRARETPGRTGGGMRLQSMTSWCVAPVPSRAVRAPSAK